MGSKKFGIKGEPKFALQNFEEGVVSRRENAYS